MELFVFIRSKMRGICGGDNFYVRVWCIKYLQMFFMDLVWMFQRILFMVVLDGV